MSWVETKRARQRLAAERGGTVKDWGGRLPIALVYPNTYYIGMSNLGFHTLYALLNSYPEVVCERAFLDLSHRSPKTLGAPPISLESQRPLTDFAILAFSLSYELDYFHAVHLLKRSGLPVFASARDERHPLVIAGGPAVAANPQPLAPIFDAIAIGEGEAILPGFLELVREGIRDRRAELLPKLAALDGLFVPASPRPVARQWVRDIDAFATTSAILTAETELSDMYLIEVERGCGRGCAFCLAGYAFRPLRLRSLDNLISQAEAGLKLTRRLGLVGAAVLDHPQIQEIVTRLGQRGAQLSLSSLRIDALSERVLASLAQGGSRSLSLAPEAGSERLRQHIKKGLTEDDILRAVELAARYGFRQIKLYFMLGLPTETDEDAWEIARLVQACLDRTRRQSPGTRLVLNISPFVPKAGTPFQRLGMAQPQVITRRLDLLQDRLRPQGIDIKAESVAWSQVQGALARGDHRLAQVLDRMKENTLAAWREALRACHLEVEQYAHRVWRPDEVLPWSMVRF
ncbi:MAG TPA: radical SAM protein [Dehalococcoidia bacterium]|nr:radical SAM protein [Dehalococcoidia bacterium]